MTTTGVSAMKWKLVTPKSTTGKYTLFCINVKTTFIKTVIGDVVAHLNRKNSPFRQIGNVRFHHCFSSSSSSIIVRPLSRITTMPCE